VIFNVIKQIKSNKITVGPHGKSPKLNTQITATARHIIKAQNGIKENLKPK
jgi:hypothetical protein